MAADKRVIARGPCCCDSIQKLQNLPLRFALPVFLIVLLRIPSYFSVPFPAFPFPCFYMLHILTPMFPFLLLSTI